MKYVAPVAELVELESVNVLLASEGEGESGGEAGCNPVCANLLVGACPDDYDGDGVNDF